MFPSLILARIFLPKLLSNIKQSERLLQKEASNWANDKILRMCKCCFSTDLFHPLLSVTESLKNQKSIPTGDLRAHRYAQKCLKGKKINGEIKFFT